MEKAKQWIIESYSSKCLSVSFLLLCQSYIILTKTERYFQSQKLFLLSDQITSTDVLGVFVYKQASLIQAIPASNHS